MSVIFLLIPLSVVLAAAFLGAFIWAVRSGQYEDTVTPSFRLLLHELPARVAPEAAKRTDGSRAAEPSTPAVASLACLPDAISPSHQKSNP
jgi:cbb3-type cytochrome oxidase maturation protein